MTDTPDNKDIIPLKVLQHFTLNYIKHTYLHWVENLYVHKTKDCDTTQVKRKCSRPPKQKIEQDETHKPAANTHTLHDLDKPIKIPKTKLLPGI